MTPHMKKAFVEIAVDAPVEGAFTYSVPEELQAEAAVGKRALVPFGRRLLTGYITATSASAPAGIEKLKPITDILDDEPIFDGKRLEFFKWVASYYFAPLGQVLSLAHPGSINMRSERSFKAVKGATRPQALPKLASEILEATGGGITLSALRKRFRDRPVHGSLRRLKTEGLIIEDSGLRGGGSTKTQRLVSALTTVAEIKGSPAQSKVLAFLLESGGEAPISAITEAIGEARDAIRRLECKGMVVVIERQVLRDPLSEVAPRHALFEPNAGQAAAIEEISRALGKGGYAPFLLYGVTGSGKTLVYLKALKEAVRLGKKAIMLAPEIALTPWPAAYLKALFPGRVALAHSALSEGERMDEWTRVVRGEADIVVGARSALFSPIKELGLIIVDEEHETSYKQEDGVRYNARDSALMLARHLGITVVLGSATPSLESFHNSRTGKLRPLVLRSRVDSRPMPTVEVLDMKGCKEVLSERLSSLLSQTLSSGKQSLLFLNRRGFSSSLLCRDCGHRFACLNCSVTLTLHKGRRQLRCHYCDLAMGVPDICPECLGASLITPGAGTERVEEVVRQALPEARVGRMDRDTASARGAVRRIIEDVEGLRLDVLIGTQMASKGHHFPGVTLVGVVSGDTSLNIPDFRSAERTFQLLAQAAGRAGRGADPGHVIIQTLNPGHYCFRSIAAHDYDSFFEEEMEERRELNYPPFARLCALRVEGASEAEAAKAAASLASSAEKLIKAKRFDIITLGPAPALVQKVKNRYRWQILLKGKDLNALHTLVSALKARFNPGSRVSLTMDMDPATVV